MKADYMKNPNAFRLTPLTEFTPHKRVLWDVSYTTGTTAGVPTPFFNTTHDYFAILIPLADLRRYPRVKTLLEQSSSELSSASRKKSSANEDRIIAEVRRAIVHLESGGVRITQKAISEIVDKPLGVLRRYPHMQALLMQVAGQDRLKRFHSEQAHLHEDELVVKLEEAVELLVLQL
jgi:hypothetical protein